jgi:glyoxylase-like metal-dependent hydrolase (beta-lactamase superfamily II)
MDWHVYAVKYAGRMADAGEYFLSRQRDMSGPQDMAYYVWVAVSGDRIVLVDTGWNEGSATKRGRDPGDPLGAALGSIGVALDDVTDVVVTHLHYDHGGNLDLLPNARLHLQQAELEFWQSDLSRRRYFALAVEQDDVAAAARSVDDGRCVLRSGDYEILPGVSAHLVRGHTPGMQVVRVSSGDQAVVLASDAVHTTHNLERDMPSRTLVDSAEMLLGFDRIRSLASSDTLVIPGHDGRVLQDFAPADPALVGRAARIL